MNSPNLAETRKPKALIIDDEQSICSSLAGVLSDEGWSSLTTVNGHDGVKKYLKEEPDLVLLDVWMAGMDGIATLQKMKQLRRDIPIVIMSGHGTIETAVKATKLGAFDYLEKPLSLEKLLPMLEHAREIKNRRDTQDYSINNKHLLIGESTGIKDIRDKIRLVAPKNAWVLITGENGTGKEVIAQQLHSLSSRSNFPFVPINCAAIPEDLIESELFGHEKGSFTNAIARKKGKFEVAHKGTLFLDEIGDMSLRTQAKILRILQEQRFERIGGRESIDVDVRVVAATNKDLAQEIKDGMFREDLYYRLNVVPFHLEALRNRGNDVILLAEHFLKEFCRELGEPIKFFSDDVKEVFLKYSWPGNVRELRNVIERVCIMSNKGQIELKDVPQNIVGFGEGVALSGVEAATLKEARSEFERSFILKKLEQNEWNVSKTAEAIGIERSNLHRKLKSLTIDPKKLKG